MSGKRGYEATLRLRQRSRSRRGGGTGKAQQQPTNDIHSLAANREEYLEALAVKNYSPQTVQGRREDLGVFLDWAGQRELIHVDEITKPILESYQRHLYRHRKANGQPLGVSTQRSRLGTLKDYFKWLCRQDRIPFNPASELELPRIEKRLPEQALTPDQIDAVLAVPDVADVLGIRDRAMLETLYSTGMRRSELVRLDLSAFNAERRLIHIRQGKGHKDRVVPVGAQAVRWLETYRDRSRPKLLLKNSETAFFLTSYGEAFNPDVLSRLVSGYIAQADIGRKGSCHLFRHTCATHMLENGADIRFIQQLLGHAKLETTSIYTEVSIGKLQQVHASTHPTGSTNRPK